MPERFDYAGYFGPILPLADALREGETRCWENGTEADKRPRDYVLYLGCNVLRTVNLAETIVAILRAMKVDFVPLGGPANCCGIIHRTQGETGTADAMLRRTFAHFAAYRPKAVLTYCPSCHERMDEALGREAALALDIPYFHVTEFIADRLAPDDFRNRVERRIFLHAHGGAPQSERDSAFARLILSRIGGLSIAGGLATGDWGPHCSSTQIRRIGQTRHAALADSLFDEARAAGAEAIVTVYHSCYRSLCRKEGEHGLPVIHYGDLIAEALGLPAFSHSFKGFALAGDPAAAFARLEGQAAARGVDRHRLQSALASHFGRRG